MLSAVFSLSLLKTLTINIWHSKHNACKNTCLPKYANEGMDFLVDTVNAQVTN